MQECENASKTASSGEEVLIPEMASFMMKGSTNNAPISTNFGSGSPIAIFTQVDIRHIKKKDLLLVKAIVERRGICQF